MVILRKEERYVSRIRGTDSPPSRPCPNPFLKLPELWHKLAPDRRRVVLATLIQLLSSRAASLPKEVTHDHA
jgi:hypothetical protein